ncbi:hypothetical protein AB0C96_35580 [Streptomyces sp. NPDC048506]|uniref:hypothetical protein n=1 Tax=Streptomyces sp. NPDC048506 TaxID=3155028 RepID=UPI0034480970
MKLRSSIATVAVAVMALAGGAVLVSPAQAQESNAVAVATPANTQGLLWQAKISAAYLNAHHKQWVSSTFVPPAGGVTGAFRCWNNNDHGAARLRIYNVETHRWIADSGYLDCNYVQKYVSADKYRPGQGLRFVLDARGKAHTTEIAAVS